MSPSYFVGGWPAIPEQVNAITLAINGQRTKRSLKIEAGAGSGKTSTLIALATYMSGTGFYIAFNKSIAQEAQGLFPLHITCNTINALAYNAFGKPYARRLNRLNGEQIVDCFNPDARDPLTESQLANCALSTLRAYCQSADRKILVRHIPEQITSRLLDPITEPLVRAEIEESIILLARKIWKEMDNTRAKLPVLHDFYLKKWALSDPLIDADYIMLDEAQDSNDVILGVLEKQAAQIIYVGDRYQAIYGWRGASNAMAKISTDDLAVISQSFRFGPQIAEVANTVLAQLGSRFTVQGFNKITSHIGALSSPDAIICRTNASCMQTAIEHLKQGAHVRFMGDQSALIKQIQAVEQLKRKGKTAHPDFNGIASYSDLVNYGESEEGSDFKSLLTIMRKYGANDLTGMLTTMDDFDDPCLVVVTAHKSKGLEWNDVQLAGDFIFPGSKRYTQEESHLLYVAITRAKKQLDITKLEDKLNVEQNHIQRYSA